MSMHVIANGVWSLEFVLSEQELIQARARVTRMNPGTTFMRVLPFHGGGWCKTAPPEPSRGPGENLSCDAPGERSIIRSCCPSAGIGPGAVAMAFGGSML